MKMSNQEYLAAYIEWKDMVNSEDVDTPERFDAYLQDQHNAEVLEELDLYVSGRMDELDNRGPESQKLLAELIPIAEFLGMDTEWYKPNAKLQALTARPTLFQEDEDARAD